MTWGCRTILSLLTGEDKPDHLAGVLERFSFAFDAFLVGGDVVDGVCGAVFGAFGVAVAEVAARALGLKRGQWSLSAVPSRRSAGSPILMGLYRESTCQTVFGR